MSDQSARPQVFQAIITGERGIGKSTLVNNLLPFIKPPITGFRTIPIFEENIKIGYAFQPWQQEAIQFAQLDHTTHNYTIDLHPFESVGCTVLKSALQSGEFIVMDELGIFEQKATNFCQLVKTILKQPRDFLIVVQQRARDFWLGDLNKAVNIYTLTAENRNYVFQQLLAQLKGK